MNKVSVIMPCFNDGEYIEESIKSVLCQTYSNIELIVIDDGSTDKKTINILDGLKKNGITVLKTNRIGPSGARNKGIEYASGDYILPLDSDDIIDSTYIKKAVEIMNSDENIGIVYCQAELFGAESGLWKLPSYSIEEMLIDNVIFVTALFRKSDWKSVGGFDTSFVHGLEDYDFWLSIIKMEREVVQIPEVLFKYRIKHKSRQQSFVLDLDNVKETYKKLYNKHIDLYKKYNDIYITCLRNTLLDQMMKNNRRINKIKRLPILGRLLKNNYLREKIKSALN